jgi:hypothetical protein
VANIFNNTAKIGLLNGATSEIDLINDTIVIIALEVNDDPDDPDTEFVADVLGVGDADEVTSTGYTGGFAGAGRLTAATPAFAIDQANNRGEWDCADFTWTSISQAGAEVWAGFLLAKELTNDASSPAIVQIDTATGLPLTPNGSNITLTIDAEGLLHFT